MSVNEKKIIKFSWGLINGSLTPISHCDYLNLLNNLLMDDGGLKYEDTLPWLAEGLKRIDSIINKDAKFADWSRETWGGELTCSGAKIYSLHDDKVHQSLDLETLRKILLSWKDFLKSKPEVGFVLKLDI